MADSSDAAPAPPLSPAEAIKAGSRFLRGNIAGELAAPLSGGVDDTAAQLLKFHGIYAQDDRDLRDERRRQKLEPDFSFMVRLRLPGGVCTPAQWLALAGVAARHGSGTLRLTTRQTFQIHGVAKERLKPALQAIAAAGLDSIGACGDVNRGVLCSARPGPLHGELLARARAVSARLLPHSRAWQEIWLDLQAAAADGAPESEPLYGPTYLPRKFKIGFALPPDNDVDIYAQDLGFIAIVEAGALAGFNVAVGGGLGRSERVPATYPRLADVIGFCAPDEAVEVAEQTLAIQRDWGDRADRRHARFKYTLDERGLDRFTGELARRRGRPLAPARDFAFTGNRDTFGWSDDTAQGRSHCTLFIAGGRLGGAALAGLNALAAVHDGLFHLTPNQNLIVADVAPERRQAIADLLDRHGLAGVPGALRRHAIACVALPTCGLAMAEGERYLPGLLDRLEALAGEYGLAGTPINIRLSGCPNGCARPYIGEIGLSGRGPGSYNLYLGGGEHGQRLAAPYLDNVREERIVSELATLFRRYAAERAVGEAFGDFVVRLGVVREIRQGREFNLPPAAQAAWDSSSSGRPVDLK